MIIPRMEFVISYEKWSTGLNLKFESRGFFFFIMIRCILDSQNKEGTFVISLLSSIFFLYRPLPLFHALAKEEYKQALIDTQV